MLSKITSINGNIKTSDIIIQSLILNVFLPSLPAWCIKNMRVLTVIMFYV